MRNLLILLVALVMSHPVIAQAQSDVSITVEEKDVYYVMDEKGVTFTVKTVNASGLTDDQKKTVAVWYYLKDDKSGKNPTAEKPERATFNEKDKVYTFTVSDLQPEKDNKCTAVMFGSVGEYGSDGFTRGDEYSVTFEVGKNDGKDDGKGDGKDDGKKDDGPEITMTFTENSSSVQDDQKNAQISVKLSVAHQNCQDQPKLYYNLYLDEEPEPIAKDVKLDTDGVDELFRYKYKATIPNLLFSRKYKVEVYATVVYDWIGVSYTYDPIEVIVTTPDDPNPAPAVSVKLGEIESKATEKDATFFVNVEAEGLTDGQKVDVYYYLQADGKDDDKKDDGKDDDKKDDGKDDDKKDDKSEGKNGTADNPAVATLGDNGVYTFTLSDLEADKSYTVVIFAGVDTKDGSVQSEKTTVEFKTKALQPEITVTFTENSSSVQDDNYAQIFVKLLAASKNLSVAPSLYYNLYLDEEPEPIAKDVKLERGASFDEYKATIPNLLFSSKYTVKVYATAADYETGEVFYTSDFTSVEVTTPDDPNPDPDPVKSIELDGISYVQTASSATFTVKELKAEGCDDADLAVYFQLSGSDADPAKATLVEKDGETYYEYTFTGLKPNTPYTAVVFGGAGEYGTDTFFRGKEYTQDFVTDDEESGVNSVETVGDVRYFDLQGTELKNLSKGRVYIKVEGNKAVKVVK